MQMTLKELWRQYNKYKTAYYEGEPLISDEEFDAFEEMIQEKGIDLKVGYDDSEEFAKKTTHPHKMLSLKKIKVGTEGLTLEQAQQLIDTYGAKATLSYKYDGMAANLIYKKGILQNIVSRGNGDEGRTLTAKLSQYVPQRLSKSIDVELRCEICMKQSTFDSLYSAEQSHARNLVAGIVRDEDIYDERAKDLSFVAIEAIDADSNFIDVTELHWFFEDNYKTNVTDEFNAEKLQQTFNEMWKKRTDFDYPTDGLVYAAEHKTFEHDGKYPDHAISLKFAPPVTMSTITSIEWKLQKTGRYVPTVHFEPVYIDGRKITRASGHNIEFLIKNELYVGSQCMVLISNDIIPYVKRMG